MKELSIEEKAKRYDKAIEIINDYYQKIRYSSLSCASNDIEVLEKAFPELIESEDVKMKNFISNELACIRATDEKGTVRYKELTDAISWIKKQGEQKPAWSEEDEKTWKELIEEVKDQLVSIPTPNCRDKEDEKALKQLTRWLDWLEFLKDRVQSQPKQEWKQENIGDLTDFENTMMHIGGSFFGDNAGLDPNDTNAIKEQANLLLELVPSKEWSERDEKMLSDINNCIKNLPIFYESININGEDKTTERFVCDTINWLKLLKEKLQYNNSKI